jgi:hypothetical protein
MSTYSKRVTEKIEREGGSGNTKASPQRQGSAGLPAPVPPPKPNASPAIIVTRAIDVGGPPPRSRPIAAPNAIGAPLPPAEPALKRPPMPPEPKTARTHSARTPSTRPTAPAIPNSPGTQASIASTFERILSAEDIDASFASFEQEGGGGGGFATAGDLDEVRSLFAQLAANYVRPVRDFMLDLRSGEASADWIAISEPALRSLQRAAEKLDLEPLCAGLETLARALAEIATAGVRTIDGERRAPILSAYGALVDQMPEAFALDLDRSQREAVIVQSLLLQVPEVKKVTIDKIVAAGLTTLESMYLATAADLVTTTGIPEALATLIIQHVREYREQVKAIAPDATRARERERLAALTSRLRAEHDEYDRVAQSWAAGAGDRKKELRKAREQTMLDIQVVLARLGEVDRLAQLERLPFEKKVKDLEAFLEEARDKYAAHH